MTGVRVTRLRALAGQHQVVAVVGARGTGKTHSADAVAEAWRATGVTVLHFDAGELLESAAILTPLAVVLGCDPDALSAEALPEGATIRVLLDRSEELFDRTWLNELQERLRALLASPAARGRVGLLAFGRPAVRPVVGGRASPLLNLGPTVGTTPFTAAEIEALFGVSAGTANAVYRKTGGHPELAGLLVQAIGGDVGNLGQVIGPFLEAHERYLMRLADDHGVGGVTILGTLLESASAVAEAELIRTAFGASFSRGLDALDDLIACGLVERDAERRYKIAAGILREAHEVRRWLRAPDAAIPTDAPGRHPEAAAVTYRVENRLREMIVDRLCAVDPLWWSTRVPETLVGQAENRRQAEADAPVPAHRLHPIMFLSLGELLEIVEYGNNWDEIFQVATGCNRAALENARALLLGARNKVAHNRPVADADLNALELGSRMLGLAAG